jgi:hypothetical protein
MKVTVVGTEYEGLNPEFDLPKQTLRRGVVLGGHNLFDPALVRMHGL